MSTHSSPPISVEQNVLLPNPTTPLSVTPSTSPSKMSLLKSELLEMRSNFEQMQQIQLERFEYLYQKDEQRRLEHKQNQSMFKLLLDKLYITTITFKSDYVNQNIKQNKKQKDLTINSIILHDTNTVLSASVVNTPAAISEPANTSDKYVSTPISLISIIPSSENQPLMPKAPQLEADMPVAATATKVDSRVAAGAHVERESIAKAQSVTPSPTQSPVTLYDICMAELTDCKLITRPRLPLLAHPAVTAHRFLHYAAHAQLVNLIPFDPGGM